MQEDVMLGLTAGLQLQEGGIILIEYVYTVLLKLSLDAAHNLV